MSAPFDEAPETGATFEDNALAKARDAFAATGLASRRRLGFGGGRVERHARSCCRRAGRAGTATTPATPRCCWRRCAMCPTAGAVRRSCRPARWCRGRARWSSVGSGGTIAREQRAATAASVMTRCLFRTGMTAPQRNGAQGRGRDIASRSCTWRVGAGASSVGHSRNRGLRGEGIDEVNQQCVAPPAETRVPATPQACLDVLGLEVLDDYAQQRDGATQQYTDGLADRPSHLDREIEGSQHIDEIHPAVTLLRSTGSRGGRRCARRSRSTRRSSQRPVVHAMMR